MKYATLRILRKTAIQYQDKKVNNGLLFFPKPPLYKSGPLKRCADSMPAFSYKVLHPHLAGVEYLPNTTIRQRVHMTIHRLIKLNIRWGFDTSKLDNSKSEKKHSQKMYCSG